jgi:flagellar basal body-associated protein FliL
MDSKDEYRQDEELTGSEPDLSGDEKKKAVGEDPARIPDKKNKFKRYIIGMVVLTTCLAALIFYSVIHNKGPEVKDIKVQQEKISVVIEDRSLVYPFIIPFEHTGEYTYIIVEVTFDVPDKKLHGEMTEKQDRIRTIIYDILLNEVERAKAIPAPAEIKKHINREVNAVLENGSINEVFVTKFMAV